jgi:hypothetical protein
MGVLVDTGLTPGDAAKAAYLLIVYVFGSIALEVAESGDTHSLPPEGERISARQAGFSAIPSETHPLSAAAAGVMAGYISTDQYLWGLHKVLDGITTRAGVDVIPAEA